MARRRRVLDPAFNFTLHRHLPPDPGPIAVAVSGGPDSFGLVALAMEYAGKAGLDLRCVTVDHGLRPEAGAEAEGVTRQLRDAGLDATVLHYDGPKPESSIQANAREIRYGLIADWMAREGIRILLLGHHREDQAETVLLCLARGSGVDGLSAMAPVSQRDGLTYLRPVLSYSKEKLERLAVQAGFKPVRDPSNEDRAHARVRIRQLADLLEKEGLSAERITGTARRMARAREALDSMRDQFLAEHVERHPAGYATFDPAQFLALPEEIRMRLLSHLTRVLGGGMYSPREFGVDAIHAKVLDGSLKGNTLSGAQIRPWRDRILICREAAGMAEPALLSDGLTWDNRYIFRYAGDEELLIGGLGEDGIGEAKSVALDAIMALPGAVRPTLPAVYRGGRLLALPHLGWCAEEVLSEGGVAFRHVSKAWGVDFRQEFPFSKQPIGPM